MGRNRDYYARHLVGAVKPPGSVSLAALARYPSPLRYPGGKGKVSNFLKALVVENDLSEHEYVEPYAGGASVALSLLYEDYVPSIHINDLNPGVFAFWRLAVEDPGKLCEWINSVSLTIDEWRIQRAIYQDVNSTLDQLGFATFYLNRTNRSGIISRGSVIGGMNQTGRWTIEARFNRIGLIERIRKIERFRSRITISRLDAQELLRRLDGENRKRFYYLDPPYYVKGGRLYDNAYDPHDHLHLSKDVAKLQQPWVISYDAAPEIIEMYKRFDGLSYLLPYSASGAASGAEVMYFSQDLRIPYGVQSPTEVSNTKLRNLLRGTTLF
jgi:DNA adenine methylase